MTARVLIVDDIPTNLKLLEARLTAEYFDVVTATSGAEALEKCATGDIDIVLLDVMMPEMDGFEVCRRLKADKATHHIPVVMVTALDQLSDRVKGLESGADDFLNKPVDDIQLIARVKSLVRLKVLTDELRARAMTSQELAAEDALHAMATIDAEGGRILVISTDTREGLRLKENLGQKHSVDVLTSPADLALATAESNYELFIVSMALDGFDPLRICSQLRTVELTRATPILLLADETDRSQVVRALDIGINDFIMRPLESNELSARIRTQLRRHRYAMELRESVSSTMQLAVVDEMTGLYNRRYFDRHLNLMLGKAGAQERDMALVIFDIDHFKSVNDNYGHDAGDAVIREFANRLRRNVRGVDMACRYGGEEFVVIMPDTGFEQAHAIAERVRSAVADDGFDIGGGRAIKVTVSAGVSLNDADKDTPDSILKRADIALYQAKQQGRNRVVFDAA